MNYLNLMKQSVWHRLFCAMLATVACTACSPREALPPGTAGNATEKKLRIAVVPKATSFQFWQSVHAGARKAAAELDVELIWKGPLSEADRESQINLVQDLITQRVDGLALAPSDSQALVGVVREAKAAGIPIVIYDSGLEGSDFASFVATDNVNGGRLAARRLGQKLNGTGNVIVLRYMPGSQSTEDRERGFLETLAAEFPEIRVVSSSEYAGATAESALERAQLLLNQYGAELNGAYTPCQHVTSGMLRALEEAQVAGKVVFVGFDAAPDLVDALRAGKLHGLVLQDPVRMGELAVQTVVSIVRGKAVAPRISTGETLATPENLEEPEIRVLLSPEQ